MLALLWVVTIAVILLNWLLPALPTAESLTSGIVKEGVADGSLGLQGRLASDIRASGDLPAPLGFDEVKAWVETHAEWDVNEPDLDLGVEKAMTIVPATVRGFGPLGGEHEQVAVWGRYLVLFDTAGEFPGLHSVRRDGELIVMHGVFGNKYDYRESR